MKRPTVLLRVLPLYVFIGLLIYLPFWQRQMAYKAAAEAASLASQQLQASTSEQTVNSEPPYLEGRPVRILIPRLAIDLPIVDGAYDYTKHLWSVADTTANYAVNTPIINTRTGTPLIYGHYYDYVFGRTNQLISGDIAYIYTDNSHIFEYVYTGNVVVDPTEVGIFEQTEAKPSLKLLTCQGTWAQNRRVMTFELVRSS